MNNGGTVFRMTPGGATTTLYSFCAQPGQYGCGDGSEPRVGVIRATDGNLYGTTLSGGANNAGTIFKITPEGTLTTLQSFGGLYGFFYDGFTYAKLLQGTDGDFYGTTTNGGSGNCANGCGTVFKTTATGAMTTLYNFCTSAPCFDGYYPVAGLVQGTDGNFYGTTWGLFGNNTFFKITPTGTLTTLNTSFYGGPQGIDPAAALVQGADGNFYGTASLGGAHSGGGIFKITPEGTMTTMYSFCEAPINCLDGSTPVAGLVQGRDGNFYGATAEGGVYGWGTVFKITPSGTLTSLHSFDNLYGNEPYGTLVQAADGNFYGTTTGGGAYGYGTVFRIGVPPTCATCRP